MRAALRPCGGSPTCPNLSGRCDTHGQRFRGSRHERGYDADWTKLRDWFMAQPENVLCCQCSAEGATVLSQDCDHILPFEGLDDPKRLDPRNLQALCRTHHNAKTRGDGAPQPVTARADRFVIAGPPNSGKTRWVTQKAKPGDLVFDLDEMAAVMAQMPKWPRPEPVVQALLAMRSGLLQWLRNTPATLRVFIIVSRFDEAHKVASQIGATVIDVQRETS